MVSVRSLRAPVRTEEAALALRAADIVSRVITRAFSHSSTDLPLYPRRQPRRRLPHEHSEVDACTAWVRTIHVRFNPSRTVMRVLLAPEMPGGDQAALQAFDGQARHMTVFLIFEFLRSMVGMLTRMLQTVHQRSIATRGR